jgi:hypothetical protein
MIFYNKSVGWVGTRAKERFSSKLCTLQVGEGLLSLSTLYATLTTRLNETCGSENMWIKQVMRDRVKGSEATQKFHPR